MPAMNASRLARCRLRRGVRVAPATVRRRAAASPAKRDCGCGGCGGGTQRGYRPQSRWCSGASAIASRITAKATDDG